MGVLLVHLIRFSPNPYSGTFFYQNGIAGACGTVHSDSDVIVAMDSALYSQSICGQKVTIWNTANWKVRLLPLTCICEHFTDPLYSSL